MARAPTTFSRLSTGYLDSASTIGEDSYDMSFIDGYCETLTSNAGVTGDLTGAVAGTTGTFSTSLSVGGGTTIEALSITTVAADFDSVTSLQPDSTITVAVASAADGDLLYAMKPSLWSGAQSQLQIGCTSGDTTGEVNLTCHNSGITSIDPASAVVTILRVNF
jgi:hypothetical protein